MKLFTYTTMLLLVGAALTFAAPDQNAIETKEKAAWQAFKDKKTDDFKKLVAADFMGVYADGISTLQGELDGMQKSDLKSFSLSDYKVVPVGADTLITTYKVTMDGTDQHGKDLSGTYNAGSVWKKQSGNWIAIFHTNVKGEAATSSSASPVPTP